MICLSIVNSLFDFFKDNANALNAIGTLFGAIATSMIGICTIMVSIITIRVYKKQNNIYREQNLLQQKLNQPFFSLYTEVSLDNENKDSIRGNETLYVENYGQKYSFIHINNNVFFTLGYKSDPDTDSSAVYVHIYDYFFRTSYNNDHNTSEVYRSHGEGANRKFGELYDAAIKDSENSSNYFFLNKVILVKISYDDVYDEHHDVFYKFSNGDLKKIQSTDYDDIISKGINNKLGYSLEEISYQTMKELMKQQEDSKEK